MQATTAALDGLPEPEGKTLLLKTEHPSEMGFGAMELDLTWKLLPIRLALRDVESTMEAAEGRHQSIVQL